MAHEPPDLLTLSEVSERLRISETGVRRLITSGALPHTVIGKRRYFVTPGQLDAYIASTAVDPDELEAQAAAIRAARDRVAAASA